MMDKDYDVFISKGELITFLGKINQFYLSENYIPRSSLGTCSTGRFSVEKGLKVALTRNSLLDIKKSEGTKIS